MPEDQRRDIEQKNVRAKQAARPRDRSVQAKEDNPYMRPSQEQRAEALYQRYAKPQRAGTGQQPGQPGQAGPRPRQQMPNDQRPGQQQAGQQWSRQNPPRQEYVRPGSRPQSFRSQSARPQSSQQPYPPRQYSQQYRAQYPPQYPPQYSSQHASQAYPPQYAAPQNPDWDQSFEESPAPKGHMKTLDKVLFALVLTAFIVVLALFLYRSLRDDPLARIKEAIGSADVLTTTNPVADENEGLDPDKIPEDRHHVIMNKTEESSTMKPLPAPAIDLELNSSAYVVYDLSSEKMLYELNADEVYDPASITKVMTTLLALENLPDLNATMTFTEEDYAGLLELDASQAGFEAGESVPLRDVLYGVMVPSGAEACHLVARTVGGTEAGFVEKMNQRAEELGMKHTKFINSSGLRIDGKSTETTAHDLLLLFKEAVKHEEFRQIAGTHMWTTTQTEQHPEGITLISTFTWKFNSDPRHKVRIIAGKSGFSGEEQTLATLSEIKDHEIIVITLGAPAENGQDAIAVGDHVSIQEALRGELSKIKGIFS